jgi:hypothetical protein
MAGSGIQKNAGAVRMSFVVNASGMRYGIVSLPEFGVIFPRDIFDLLPGELLRGHAGRRTGFTEKAVQAGRGHNPEQEKFVIRILKSMPGVFGNKNRSAFFKRVTHIVQNESPAAFQNEEGFVHLEVPVDWDAGTGHYLLGSQREILRASGGPEFDENVSTVTEMKEMFAFGGTQHVSLPRGALARDDSMR